MIMEIRNLGFSYDGKKDIFANLNMSLHTSEILSIIGPNGIGKTTLLKCMANLMKPSTGTIFIDNHNMFKMPRNEVAQKVAYVPQTVAPSFDYPVLDYVVTGCAPYLGIFEQPGDTDYQRAMKAIEKMGIAHLTYKPYTKISGGELQQVSIARALTQQAQIILMDEPTSHLDYGNQIKVLRLIRKMASTGYGIVLTTHNPDHPLLLGGKVAAFDREGAFYYGESRDILTKEILSKIYDIELRLQPVEGREGLICVPPEL